MSRISAATADRDLFRQKIYHHGVLVVVVGLLCLVLGLCAGWVIGRRRMLGRERAETPAALLDPVEPQVPDGVSEVLGVLRSAGIVVGPHDEVLRSSALARTLGLVRGSRIIVSELLEVVREVRRSRESRAFDIELSRGRGAPMLFLSVRTAPLGEDLVIMLAEDRTVARRVEHTRRDFVANVSHELKTPIGAIGLLCEAVAAAADDPVAITGFANRMQRESQRLSELVSQIIELSRLQADDPLLSAAEVDVDDVLASAVDSCRVDAEQHKVTLTLAGRRGLSVLGNADQLTTAMRNLVRNGVSYSDAGARVTVGARAASEDGEDFIDLTVSDNGIGIATDDVPRIFERFYRVDYGRSRANGGTGLGLSIVKHIAAAHRGQVTVWSKLGQGSTFTIRLPSINDVALHHAAADDVDPDAASVVLPPDGESEATALPMSNQEAAR